MSPNAQNIANQINSYIRNYPIEGFQNMRLNAILLQMLALADGNGGGAIGTGQPDTIAFFSADFTNATDCPDIDLNGIQFSLYWNEGQRYLLQDAAEWAYLAGGGFKVTMAGFNAMADNYHFFVEISSASAGSTIPIVSANFSDATTCAIPSLNGKNIAIFWNEAKRYILKDAFEWSDLPGGGFTILISGFDSTTTNYHLYVQVL